MFTHVVKCLINMEDNFTPFAHFSTDALHVGQEPEQWNSRAVVPPLSLSTTFKQDEPGKHSVRVLQYVLVASE